MAGAGDHVLDRVGVLRPLLAVPPVLIGQLPALQRILLRHQPFDRASLAGGIPALEDRADRRTQLPLADHPAEREPELGQPPPAALQPGLFVVARELLRQLDFVEGSHQKPVGALPLWVWIASWRRPMAARISTIPKTITQLFLAPWPYHPVRKPMASNTAYGPSESGRAMASMTGYLSSPRCRTPSHSRSPRFARGSARSDTWPTRPPRSCPSSPRG